MCSFLIKEINAIAKEKGCKQVKRPREIDLLSLPNGPKLAGLIGRKAKTSVTGLGGGA